MELREGIAKLISVPKGRWQWLNDRLCRHAAACANFEEMMDVAMTLNQELAKRGLEPLDDEEVFRRTQKVWQDAQDGKLETWVGREGVARITGRELQVLCELGARTGPDAYTLLAHLRVSHSLRCKRGETFSITPKAMSRDNVIPGWVVNGMSEPVICSCLLASSRWSRPSPILPKAVGLLSTHWRSIRPRGRGRCKLH